MGTLILKSKETSWHETLIMQNVIKVDFQKIQIYSYATYMHNLKR